MISSEFEAHLVVKGFYFESPSLFVPSANLDAEYYTSEQLMDILTHEGSDENKTGGFRAMVRKRSESTGTFTYYFKDEAATEYFKVTCPTSTGANLLDAKPTIHTIKQIIDTIKVRIGLF